MMIYDGHMDTLKGSDRLLIIVFLCVNELSSWTLDCLNVRPIHGEPEAGKENGFDHLLQISIRRSETCQLWLCCVEVVIVKMSRAFRVMTTVMLFLHESLVWRRTD